MRDDFPAMAVPVNHVEPVPRRVRGYVGTDLVFDTLRARYVWEVPYYPQFYIPSHDVRTELLVDEQHSQQTRRGPVRTFGLHAGDSVRPAAARLLEHSDVDGLDTLDGTFRFEWAALDTWFEEDERVFVHPRNPYVRVDALRSNRSVEVSLDGVVLARTNSPVLVFETGLPTRYYISRTDVNFEHLVPTETETECPYKGTTSEYWSVHIGDTVHSDLVWSYQFPTRELLAISGLIAFYNEQVDISIDGQPIDRPKTHFFVQ